MPAEPAPPARGIRAGGPLRGRDTGPHRGRDLRPGASDAELAPARPDLLSAPATPPQAPMRPGPATPSPSDPALPPGAPPPSDPALPPGAPPPPSDPALPPLDPALPPLDALLPTRHVTSTKIIAVRGKELEVRDDLLVGEEPLEIRAAGPRQEPVSVAVTMRTPGYEDELALGFLTSEGLLRGNEVTGIRYGDPGQMAEPDDSVLVRLARPFDASRLATRNFVATASCGICGKASIDDVAVRCEPLPVGLPVVSRAVILSLPDKLRAGQAAFERTGGLHAAGLFETDGRLVAVREDVGRHNALDKLIGSRVRANELPLWDRILIVSGRTSFEIVQKAAVAGIAVICAVSAPSDLAVRLADRLGVTLVGFLRADGFNVYSHDGRIDLRDLLG